MVVSGHDHAYQRAEHGGVRYFVTGGGGAPLYGKASSPSAADAGAVKAFDSSWHLLAVTVRDDRVEVRAIRVDGSPIETTAWVDDVAGARSSGAATSAQPVAPTRTAAGDADYDDEAPVSGAWVWLLAAAVASAIAGLVLLARGRRAA